MKKITFYSGLLALLFIGTINSSKAQGLFYAQSATVNTAVTDSCVGLTVDVLTWMGCINFVVGPTTYFITGNVITVEIGCTSSMICAGAISQPVGQAVIPSLPTGNYTVNANAYLDRVLVNTVSAGTVQVNNCNTTGLSELNLNQINLSPIPAKDFIRVSGISNNQNYSYDILDIKGSKIQSSVLNEGRIELLEMNPGIYFLRIYSDAESVVKRIVIQ